MQFPRFVMVLLWCALLTGPLAAKDDWVKVSTPNFVLYTSGGEGSAKRTVLYFERIRTFFLQSMNLSSNSDQPVRIIGFRNDKEFEPFRPTEFASAYYTQNSGRDTIVLGRIGAERYETAVHEYMHLLVRNTGADFPPWLNEGLAEMYSTLQPIGKQVQVGQLPMGRMQALETLKWIPLERLLEVRRGDPEYGLKEHAGAFYAESWALVHLLNLHPDYYPRMPEFLTEVLAGRDGAKAFRKVYNQKPDEVEKTLRAYIRQTSFLVLNHDIQLERSSEEPIVEPASDLDTRLILAGLLAGQQGKADEAAERLEALAAEYPQSPEVAEAQGYVAWRGREAAEATAHFERAAELGGANPKMYRDLAGLSRGSRDLDFQIRMLKKSLELDPGHMESRRILGHLYIHDQQWANGVIELNKVTKVKTNEEAFVLHQARAFAYFHLNDVEQAEKLAKLARKHSDNLQQTAQLELLLNAIARMKDDTSGTVAAASLLDPRPPPSTSEDFEKPILERRDFPEGGREVPVDLIPEQPRYAGMLVQFDCLGEQAKLHVDGDGGRRVFALIDPMNVLIKRNGEAAPDVSFTCGPQAGRPIEVTYAEPEAGIEEASVISLDFLDALPE